MKIYATVRVTDVETTGLKPPAGLVELGWCDVHARSEKDGVPCNWEVDKRPFSVLINPGHPIPPEASGVHHLTDKDVEGAPDAIDAIRQMLSPHSWAVGASAPVAYAAHSWRFELQWLEEFTGSTPWICSERCARHVYRGEQAAPDFKNQTLRYFLKPRGLKPALAMPPHRAGPDCYVTAFHVRELLNRGNTVDRLIKATQRVPILEICLLGKQHGKPYSEVDSGFLRWLLDPARVEGFSEEDVATARHYLDERAAMAKESRFNG